MLIRWLHWSGSVTIQYSSVKPSSVRMYTFYFSFGDNKGQKHCLTDRQMWFTVVAHLKTSWIMKQFFTVCYWTCSHCVLPQAGLNLGVCAPAWLAAEALKFYTVPWFLDSWFQSSHPPWIEWQGELQTLSNVLS